MGNGSATTAQQARAHYERTSGTATRSRSAKATTASAYAPLTRSATPAQQQAVQAIAHEWAQHSNWRRERAAVFDAQGARVVSVDRGHHHMTPQQLIAATKAARAAGPPEHQRAAQSSKERIFFREAVRSAVYGVKNPAPQVQAIRLSPAQVRAAKAALKTAKSDSSEEITLTLAQKKAVRAAARPEFTHTHPQGSFSRADVYMAMADRYAAFHAVGPGPGGRVWQFTIRPGPKAGAHGLWSRQTYEKLHVGGAYTRLDKQVYDEFNARIRSGRMTVDQANLSHEHEIMTRLAREYGPDVLRYEAGPLQ